MENVFHLILRNVVFVDGTHIETGMGTTLVSLTRNFQPNCQHNIKTKLIQIYTQSQDIKKYSEPKQNRKFWVPICDLIVTFLRFIGMFFFNLGREWE